MPGGRAGISTFVAPLAEKPGWFGRVFERVAEEVAVAGGDAFAEAASLAGYAIERTTIEGHGRCPACRVAA